MDELNDEHIHPVKKKNKDPVVFGIPESVSPKKYMLPSDNHHNVITLLRWPEDLNDVDYACGFGRTNKTGKPEVPFSGIPGMGSVFGTAVSIFNYESHLQSGYCVIYKLDGNERRTGERFLMAGINSVQLGVLENIKRDQAWKYKIDHITLIRDGSNRAEYRMLGAWDELIPYLKEGEFKRKFFEYKLFIFLVFTLESGNEVTYSVLIITNKEPSQQSADLVYTNILPLSLMFGCLA